MEKAHQIAIYHQRPGHAKKSLESRGFKKWIPDTCAIDGMFMTSKGWRSFSCSAEMWFNYEFFNGELEFLHYDGPSWHSQAGRTDEYGHCGAPFLSHLSVHSGQTLAPGEEVIEPDWLHGFEVIEWFKTSDHENQYLLDKRQTFYEHVYDTRAIYGYDIKLITRVQN